MDKDERRYSVYTPVSSGITGWYLSGNLEGAKQALKNARARGLETGGITDEETGEHVNEWGLSFQHWLWAAGVSEHPDAVGNELWRAWERGEDPSEHRAKTQGVRG